MTRTNAERAAARRETLRHGLRDRTGDRGRQVRYVVANVVVWFIIPAALMVSGPFGVAFMAGGWLRGWDFSDPTPTTYRFTKAWMIAALAGTFSLFPIIVHSLFFS